jgi:putative ubiquitin-RnfH superfamily antitoxin RatB of RatAB toxin-antitoxin module
MPPDPATIRVSVVFCPPEPVWMRDVVLPAGATVASAIERSGLLVDFPQLREPATRAGVYGQLAAPDAVLRDGDRVEVYRPLSMDPKEARRHRAELRRRRRAAAGAG